MNLQNNFTQLDKNLQEVLELNQVFINLLSNAVKYTPAGGTITFRIMQKTTFRHGYGDYKRKNSVPISV